MASVRQRTDTAHRTCRPIDAREPGTTHAERHGRVGPRETLPLRHRNVRCHPGPHAGSAQVPPRRRLCGQRVSAPDLNQALGRLRLIRLSHRKFAAAAIGMLLAGRDDHAPIRRGSHTRHRRSPIGPSAATEPGAVLQPSPPRTRWREASHALDRMLALGETVDATKAHAHLGVSLQPKQAGGDKSVTAAPTTRLWRFDVVATHSSSVHAEPRSSPSTRCDRPECCCRWDRSA